ncbi:MAG: CHASE2 domain-containing protein, partial [Thermodesulfobacteriota bacterium]
MSERLKSIARPSGLKVGLLVTAVSLFIYFSGISFFELIELKAYDYNFKTRGKVIPGDEVVIIGIDEKSVDTIGRWPWPRTTMAKLVDTLGEYGARAIAFDVIFSESDENSGLGHLTTLKKSLVNPDKAVVTAIEKIERESDNDALFAEAIANNPAVVLGYFFHMSKLGIAHEGEERKEHGYRDYSRFVSVRSIDGVDVEPNILVAVAAEENIELLAENASNFGSFNIKPDIDGTVRRAPLVIGYNDSLYPHLSLEALRVFSGSPPLILNVASHGVDHIMMGPTPVITDESGSVFINYRGPSYTFPHYSFSDVISGALPPETFKDKIVLVGATAIGIYDMRVVPFEGVYPGVEIHANIIDNMLKGDFIKRPKWTIIYDVLVIMILGVLLSVIVPRLRPVYIGMVVSILLGGYIVFNHYAFVHWHIWLTFVYPVFTVIFVAASVTIFQFMTEEKKKKEIRNAFSHYVAPSLVEQIAKNPEQLNLGGEEKRLTVFF